MSKAEGGVNLGDLAGFEGPLTELVKKTCSGIGIAYDDHWGIVRRAKSEAKARLILNEADEEIQRRAAQRLIAEETRKQKNIESILCKAGEHLNEDATPSQIEDDWIAHFFECSEGISDKEMQDLWAKVLAGESNSPKSFSRKTINLLKDLDREHAMLFNWLCNLLITFTGNSESHFEMRRIVLEDRILVTRLGHYFPPYMLDELILLGLIQINSSPYQMRLEGSNLYAHYNGQIIEVINNRTSAGKAVNFGYFELTPWGEQISNIIESEPLPNYWHTVMRFWENQGHSIKVVDELP